MLKVLSQRCTVFFHGGCANTSLLPVLMTAVMFALAGCGKGPSGNPSFQMGGAEQATGVGVMTVVPRKIVQTTELSGRLSALRVADVRPQVSGIVLKRLFTEGSDVKAGQLLYQIDPATYQASYDQAKGTLANAQATLASAKTKADRYVELIKINAVSKQDYDDALAAVNEDQATVIANRASLESARVNLEHTRIKAPISGRIGASTVTEGALVTSDQTTALTTIQAFDQMYLDVSRSSMEWLRLRKEFAASRLQKMGESGAAVKLVMEDGTEYGETGVLQFTGISVDATTGSVTLRMIFPNPNQELLPGMFVRAQLNEGEDNNAILVPQLAVSRASDGKATVYVVDAANNAKQVIVQANTAYGDQWIVTQGLKAGDRVIVSGLQKVHAGASVKIAADSASAGASAVPAVAAKQ